MHADVRLGRVAGIDIGVNWTWLIVVALIIRRQAVHELAAAVAGLVHRRAVDLVPAAGAARELRELLRVAAEHDVAVPVTRRR